MWWTILFALRDLAGGQVDQLGQHDRIGYRETDRDGRQWFRAFADAPTAHDALAQVSGDVAAVLGDQVAERINHVTMDWSDYAAAR